MKKKSRYLKGIIFTNITLMVFAIYFVINVEEVFGTFIVYPGLMELLSFPVSLLTGILPWRGHFFSLFPMFLQVNLIYLLIFKFGKRSYFFIFLSIWFSYFYFTIPQNTLYTETLITGRLFIYKILSAPTGFLYDVGRKHGLSDRQLVVRYFLIWVFNSLSVELFLYIYRRRQGNRL